MKTTQTQHSALPVAQFGEDVIFNLRKMPSGERVPVGTQLYMTQDYERLQAINAQLLEALKVAKVWIGDKDPAKWNFMCAAIAAAEGK